MSQQGREKIIPNNSEKLEKGVINPKSDELRAICWSVIENTDTLILLSKDQRYKKDIGTLCL